MVLVGDEEETRTRETGQEALVVETGMVEEQELEVGPVPILTVAKSPICSSCEKRRKWPEMSTSFSMTCGKTTPPRSPQLPGPSRD
eukprot:Nitzschia sp. Nitz4//scaffold114_size70088//60338//60622//NITZ4_005988-RA/size70088-exonerate_est2genome-gene-0.76-mRNA-1//-1//CDS//3329533456//7417//frame0